MNCLTKTQVWSISNRSRLLHETHTLYKKSTSLKGKKITSQTWLKRQLRDPLVKEARAANWRCRSAFKLLELNTKFRLLQPGHVVVDCGAAPGSWTQVAVQEVNSKHIEPDKPRGQVIGIDLLPMSPIEGATLLENSDFTRAETQEKVVQIMQWRKANVVLSDMAPNATGMKSMDHELIVDLCHAALRFAVKVLSKNGHFVCKLWQGNEQKRLENTLRQFFDNVRIAKPQSSRQESAEIFLVALRFKGALSR